MPKQVIVQSSLEAVEIIETPIPSPQEDEIVIKVVVSGTNPKDWKYPSWYGPRNNLEFYNVNILNRKNLSFNSGDDVAGIVHSVGKRVYEFKPGDRVAAFHQPGTDNGSFAEYSVAPELTTFHIPQNISFEEAATVPLAALTAAIALYADMGLPTPYNPVKAVAQGGERVPILIYGVTSAVGAFAAQLARLSGLSPIIGVSGRAGEFAKNLVDHVIDYRNGEDALVAAVEDILAKEGLSTKVPNIFDAISENGSIESTFRFIDPNGGIVSNVLPTNLFAKDKENFSFPSGVKAVNSAVPQVFTVQKDFGYIWSRYLSRLLEDGRLKAHPYEVIPGGLNGVLVGLQKLRDGKASAVKYVYRVEDTTEGPLSSVKTSGATATESGDEAKKGDHQLKNFPFPAKE